MRRRALDPDLTFGEGGSSSRQRRGHNNNTAANDGGQQQDRGGAAAADAAKLAPPSAIEKAPKRFKPLQLDHGPSSTAYGRRSAIPAAPFGRAHTTGAATSAAAAPRLLRSALDRGSWAESLASSLAQEGKRKDQLPASRRKVDDVAKRTRYGSEVRKEQRRARAALRNDYAPPDDIRSVSRSGQSPKTKSKARAGPEEQSEAPIEAASGDQAQASPSPPHLDSPGPSRFALASASAAPTTPHAHLQRRPRLLALDTPAERSSKAKVAGPPGLTETETTAAPRLGPGEISTASDESRDLDPHPRAALTIYEARRDSRPRPADGDEAVLNLARRLWPSSQGPDDDDKAASVRVVRPIIFRGAKQIGTYFAPYADSLTLSRNPPSHQETSAWAAQHPGGASTKDKLWATTWAAEEEWTDLSQQSEATTTAAAASSSL